MGVNIMNIMVSSSRLPSGYQEVEYIESSGTQYINIGPIFSSINNVIYFKGELDNTSGTQSFLGLYNGSGQDFAFKFVNGSSLQIWNGNSAIVFNDTGFEVEIQYSSSSTVVNDVTKTYSNASTSNYDCHLFGYNDYRNQGSSEKLSGKIYYLRVNDGSTDVINLIPCYRTSDDEIGLYDLVNDVFYTNDGTGTFAKGNDAGILVPQKVKTHIISNNQSIPVKVNIIAQNPNSHNLPSGYQEVEYITSEGHQYIDTQFIPNQDTRVKTKVYITGGNGSYPGPYGANAGNWADKSYSTAFGASVTYDEYNNDVQIGGGYRNQLIEIDKNKNVLYFNGTIMRTHNQATFTPNVSMYVFTINWNDEPSQYIAGNMYYLQVYDDSTLVRDFVPCYRKSDNAIGMYDLLNSGKNLFDLASIIARNNNVKLKRQNGNITITNNNSYAINGLNGWLITLDTGTYTMSISEAISNSIAVYNADTDSWISNGIYHGNTSGTFTLAETTRIYFNVLLAQGVTEIIKHLQLEKNNSATSYEPCPFYGNIGSGLFTKGNDVNNYNIIKI